VSGALDVVGEDQATRARWGWLGPQIVEFSPSDEYAQRMAAVAKNLQGLGS
jgi:hypothetical protein